MKIKQYVYITHAEAFARGVYTCSLTLSGDDNLAEFEHTSTWILAGHVELDIDIDNQTLADKQIAIIRQTKDKERAEHQFKMDLLDEKENKLLCIEHKGASDV